MFLARPNTLLIAADGSIWVAGKNSVQIFLDKLTQKFEYEFLDGIERDPEEEEGWPEDAPMRDIMGIFEHNNTVKFVIKDLTEILNLQIFLYDTATKTHYKLPLECSYDDYPDFICVEDTIQLFDHDKCGGLCTLDPPIKPLHKLPWYKFTDRPRERVTASPYGSRLLVWKIDEGNVHVIFKEKATIQHDEDEISYQTIAEADIHFEEEKIEPDPGEKKKKRKKGKGTRINIVKYQNRKPIEVPFSITNLGFFWLSNDIVIATHQKRLAVR